MTPKYHNFLAAKFLSCSLYLHPFISTLLFSAILTIFALVLGNGYSSPVIKAAIFVISIMFFKSIHFSILATFSLLVCGSAAGIFHREPCAEDYSPCSPPGATSSIVPPVGDALSGLYFDLVSSVNPQPVSRDVTIDNAPHQARDVSSTICCE